MVVYGGQGVAEVAGHLFRVDVVLLEDEGVERLFEGALGAVVELVAVPDAGQVVERGHRHRKGAITDGLYHRSGGQMARQHPLKAALNQNKPPRIPTLIQT